MDMNRMLRVVSVDVVRDILKEGSTNEVVQNVALTIPREIAVELMCALEAYNASVTQYQAATRGGKMEGTAAEVALEADMAQRVHTLYTALEKLYAYSAEALAEQAAETGVMTLEATDDLSEEELAERAAQTEKEQAAASALEGYVAAQAERYQAALQDAVLDGVLSVEEYDNVAETPYKQLRREMYDGAVLEAKKELGEDVAGGKLSHADYFAITGEEYTVAAGETGTEEAAT